MQSTVRVWGPQLTVITDSLECSVKTVSCNWPFVASHTETILHVTNNEVKKKK